MRTFTRRSFGKVLAKSATAGLLFAPFYAQLAGKAVAAPGKAKRLLLFCTMGTHPPMWSPTNVAGESSFGWSAMTEPLAKIKQHLVLIEGLPSGNPGNGHGAPDGLAGTGYGNALSVDQFVADKLKASGVNTPIPVLLLGADTNAGGGRTMFNRGNNLTTIASPLSAYNTIFTGSTAPSTGTGGTGGTPMPDKQLARRKSILDVVKGEIATLNQAVGAEEKAKLELHLQSIRQLENRLTPMTNPGGGGGPVVACTKPSAPADEKNVLAANQLHMDLIVRAFACDITRVAAIQFGSDQSMQVDLPDLGIKSDQHGGMLHSGAPEFKQLIALERWLAQRFVDLVEKLKATPDPSGSGTLFDGTLVAWCRDMGDAVVHNQQSMRFVLAGGAGGYLRTNPNGRYLKGPGDGAANRHERVLLNLCEAVGVSNFSGFGDSKLTGADKTPIPGLRA